MIKEHDVMDCIAKKNLHRFEKVLLLSTLFAGLLLIFLVAPAIAVTGSFDSVGGLISTSYSTNTGTSGATYINGIKILNIQNQTGFNSLFMTTYSGAAADVDSDTTPVNLYEGNTLLGTGQFGFSYSSVSTQYSVYLFVSSFDPGTLTGTHYLNFTTPSGMALWNLSGMKVKSVATGTEPTNSIVFASGGVAKVEYTYVKYQSAEFHNTYVTSYASPISTILVTKIISLKPYPSQVYIMQGTTVLASNTTLTTDNFTVNLAGAPYFTINATDMWGNWYVSPLIYGAGTAPVYTISVLPANITTTTSASGGITSTIDPLLNGIIDIGWKWSDAAAPYYNEFYDSGNTSRPLLYAKKGTTWYGWDNLADDYMVNKGASIPNPVILSGITTSGEKIVRCVIMTSDGNAYILTAPLTVGGANASGTVTTGAKLIDALSGNYITGGTVSFQNVATGTWTNQTTTSTGKVYVSSSPSVKWNLWGTASGYITVSRFGLDSSTPGSTSVYALTMYPSSYLPAPGGATTLLATVTSVCQQQYQNECSDLPLDGVTVTIRSTDGVTFSQSGVTGTGTGMYVPNHTAYFWSANKIDGTYESVSGNFTVSDEPVYTLGIQMAQIFVTPTPSLAPGQTPMPTGVTPTMTQAAGQSIQEFRGAQGIDLLSQYVVPWMNLAAGIVSIWLLWILVYEMTGGKVLGKLMRRGRGKG
jgi:hypothetical protein